MTEVKTKKNEIVEAGPGVCRCGCPIDIPLEMNVQVTGMDYGGCWCYCSGATAYTNFFWTNVF